MLGEPTHSELVDTLLEGLQGGEFHHREKIGEGNNLPFSDFAEIGQVLRSCSSRANLINAFLDRLEPYSNIIIGVLPPGIQSHSLIPEMEQELSDRELLDRLQQISDQQLRQWIIEDGSLVYGELNKPELRAYFSEIEGLLRHRDQFIDLGSGLGKVVMTGALSLHFQNYVGVELLPYRHRLAQEGFSSLCAAIQSAEHKISGSVESANVNRSGIDIDLIRRVPNSVTFQLKDMFECDVSDASLIFMYSTCFGSLMQRISEKLANEAKEGCLVSVTSFPMRHPGLKLVKHFPARSLAWTDVRIYERVGYGPWPTEVNVVPPSSNVDQWRRDALDLLPLGDPPEVQS